MLGKEELRNFLDQLKKMHGFFQCELNRFIHSIWKQLYYMNNDKIRGNLLVLLKLYY